MGENASGEEFAKPSTTISRAVDVLVLFTNSPEPELGVTEIAQAVGLSKAVVHRILSSLRTHDFVTFNEQTRRYALGVGAMHLGLAYMKRIDIRLSARPELEALSAATNETATLSVRNAWQRVYIDQVVPAREVIMSIGIGESIPLHAGASSKTFLAFMSPEDIDEYFATHELASLTQDTVTDVDALRAELRQIREQGWARSSAERKGGAASVAAPVLDHLGEPVAVISVCGPLDRFSDEFETCKEALLKSTERLSLSMGWKPNP
jgi:IclR family acetate operon transcriptional repressor